MSLSNPVYFLQTQKWLEFWKSANNSNHNYHFFELKSKNFKLNCFIYEYPWQLKQKFWYIPRFSILEVLSKPEEIPTEKEELLNLTLNLLQKITSKAKKQQITFLKLDFNDQLFKLLKIKNLASLKNFFLEKTKYSCNFDTKIIQFTSTMFLNLTNLQLKKDKEELNLLNLQNFFDINKEFWQKVDSEARRCTKKSLERNWEFTIEKTETNFEIFYDLLTKTSKIQNFAIQPKEYLHKLYWQDFSTTILLKKNNKYLTASMLVETTDTIVSLYTGNNREGFKDFSSYILYLIIFFLGKKRNLQFYDFGGYNPQLSFSNFKDGYKGKIRHFLGPFDIILYSNKYYWTNFLIKIRKIFVVPK